MTPQTLDADTVYKVIDPSGQMRVASGRDLMDAGLTSLKDFEHCRLCGALLTVRVKSVHGWRCKTC